MALHTDTEIYRATYSLTQIVTETESVMGWPLDWTSTHEHNASNAAETALWRSRLQQRLCCLLGEPHDPRPQSAPQNIPENIPVLPQAADKLAVAHGIKTSPSLCLSCGHSIDAHDRQYGCAEDGCDCETPNDGGKP